MNIKKKKSKGVFRKVKRIKSDLPAVFLSLKDNRTPFIAKIIAGVLVIYALSPIDFIPDFIPFIGYLDDILILPGLMFILIKLIPEDVWKDAQMKSKKLWLNGRPKHWYYAIPIILFWIIIVIWLIHIWKTNLKNT
ncbi:hypothetical protein HMPREF9318_00386 [Streptococcus urinalis FB127-CNA-2]|uniref:DUF1232 domain-containing protein n=2 Tax=Streptococcus urinalis TaxID=149016 RepID=G5KFX8_9STRE|nr:YkvA family protein [Streptococcus urinalis]EHJ57078.1 hypothetical protein STRUR_1137 [Streptococcus urinalis 2285-97]EKS22188.1 hypothetical protein HMPREF9318_00386 [Streptococcus urinalis FB127-CNA-2]VEF32000.1 Uncharacterized conserved protein [Streptococcus urinalis]